MRKVLLTMKRAIKLFVLVALVGAAGVLLSAEAVVAQSTYDCTQAQGISVPECEALVALYNSTDGDNWIKNTRWLQTGQPCKWYGVACPGGNVMNLDLSGNNLTGSIPPELGNLTEKLKLLKLNGNNLTGPIPPQLGDLAELQTLWLHNNYLSGPVPSELGDLSNLQRLQLNNNSLLSGPLPVELTKLTLNTFWFENTNLCIPPGETFETWLSSINDKPASTPWCPVEPIDVEARYYLDGVDLGDSEYFLHPDPTVLIVVKGQESGIAESQIPDNVGDFTGFDSYQPDPSMVFRVDFFFGYEQYNQTEGAYTITVRNDNEYTNIIGMAVVGDGNFDDIVPKDLDFEYDLEDPLSKVTVPIDTQSIVVFKTGELDPQYFKIGNFAFNNWTIGFDLLEIDENGNPISWDTSYSLTWSTGSASATIEDAEAFFMALNVTSVTIFIELMDSVSSTFEVLGGVYDFTMVDENGNLIEFFGDENPVLLTFQSPYDLLPGGEELSIWYFAENGDVIALDTFIDYDKDLISAYTTHFSAYGAMPGEAIPEPSTLILLGLGLFALVGIGRWRRKMKQIIKFFVLVALVGAAGLLLNAEAVVAQSTYDCTQAQGIAENECEALVALYNSTDGDNWIKNTKWLQTDQPCKWYGVACPGGYVMNLDLSGNNLTGPIPPELGNLTEKLKLLKLNDNNLSGSIPPELGDLAQLQTLWLHNNNLEGNLPPQLGTLGNLQRLQLNNNPLLSGPLPVELKNLTLNTFWFENTNLCIPPGETFETWLNGINDKPDPAPWCTDSFYDYFVYDEWGGYWQDYWHDADQGETNLCWAANASNILAWTGWGAPAGTSFSNEQDIFDITPTYWDDSRGGLMNFHWEWWFTGEATPPTEPLWSQVNGHPRPGGYWPGENFVEYFRYWGGLNLIPAIQTFFRLGYGVTVTAYPPGTGSVGHAFTIWGYRYDYEANGITGLYMTDSEDEAYNMFFLPGSYNGYLWSFSDEDGVYYESGAPYINLYPNWNIEGVMALARRSDIVTITSIAVPGGMNPPTISPIGTVKVIKGEQPMFFITSTPDYPLEHLWVDGVDKIGDITDCITTGKKAKATTTCKYTFDPVTTDHTIQAIFLPPSAVRTITASAESNGKISPSGQVYVEDGGDRTFIMLPDIGYRISDVLVKEDTAEDWQSTGPAMKYTFENVTTDKEIKARFVEEHLRLAIVEKKCLDIDTGEEVACEDVVHGTVQVGDQEIGPDSEMIVVPFSEFSSLILKAEPGSEEEGFIFYRWEKGDGTTVEGIVDTKEDIYLRPVYGCSESN